MAICTVTPSLILAGRKPRISPTPYAYVYFMCVSVCIFSSFPVFKRNIIISSSIERFNTTCYIRCKEGPPPPKSIYVLQMGKVGSVCWKGPDSKVHGANMGPTWVLSAPDGPHVCPMNLVFQGGGGGGGLHLLVICAAKKDLVLQRAMWAIEAVCWQDDPVCCKEELCAAKWRSFYKNEQPYPTLVAKCVATCKQRRYPAKSPFMLQWGWCVAKSTYDLTKRCKLA